MFNLHKELDEVRLEYYILKQARNGLIELTLTDIATLLGVNRSKAQRLVEKFIKLNILKIEVKSTSKTTKTIYRYMQPINIDTDTNTNKSVFINEPIYVNDTKKESEDDTLVSIYESRFKLNSFMEEQLKLFERYIDIELFEHLVDQIVARTDIKSKEGYLITTLKDLKKCNVRTIEDFFSHTERHKKESKRQKLANQWGYTPGPEIDMDFDKIAEMTKHRL